MPPLVLVALGVVGVAALAKVVSTQARRVHEVMARQRANDAAALQPIALVRDPLTGEYRPRQP